MGHSSGPGFSDILSISFFFSCLFISGLIAKKIGFSGIIGEMIAGMLLGPYVWNVVPHQDFFELAGMTFTPCMAVLSNSALPRCFSYPADIFGA